MTFNMANFATLDTPDTSDTSATPRRLGLVGLLGALALGMPILALACSCIYQGRFVEFAKGRPVIRATVLSLDDPLPFADRDHYRHMTVRVDDVIRGGDYAGEDGEMVFNGDTGASCRTYITGSQFPPGSEHLIITANLAPTQDLLGCGEPAVRITGDRVIGADLDRPLQPVYTLGLAEVLNQLAAP